MPALILFDCFVQDVGRKVHNLNADTLKVILSNTAPALSDAVLTDLVEIAGGNGYTAGGHAITANAFSQTSGTAVLTGGSVVITASGGSIGPFQYAAVYNDTAAGDPLIGYIDHGASITLTPGESYTFDIDPINGLFSLG